VTEGNIAEEMAQLRRENQELKAENERLRRMCERVDDQPTGGPFLAPPPKA
jgi:cell shape-determining protein MreC